MFMFVTKSVVEMFQLQGCIGELNFGYTAKKGWICEHEFGYDKVRQHFARRG